MGGRKDKIMTTRDRLNEWVNEWYEWLRGEISRNIAKDRMSEYSDDLLHHLILDLYKMPDDKIEGMLENGKLRWYLLRGAGMQLRSSTSPFYRTHRREKMNSREHGLPGSDKNIFEKEYEPYEDDLYECFLREMNNLHWYQKTLMDKYWIEGLNLTQIYKHYNISKTHIINDLNEAMRTIRTKCNQC